MLQIALAAVLGAVLAAPAAAFDLRPGAEITVGKQRLVLHEIEFSAEDGEPPELELAFDIMPYGRTLEGERLERVGQGACGALGIAPGALEVLGMTVEAISIVLYTVTKDGDSTSRSGSYVHC
jgi:hypothetical protein